MKLILLLSIFLISCSSKGVRTLSDKERLSLGLVGIAHDLRICPTIYDENTHSHRVSGSCELVDCEMEKHNGAKVVCKAKPEEALPSSKRKK